MGKLAAPMIAKATRSGRSASPYNEGVSVPQAEWDKVARKNPAINSKNVQERGEAVRKEILKGDLAKFRRR